jgi:hypothetical protein
VASANEDSDTSPFEVVQIRSRRARGASRSEDSDMFRICLPRSGSSVKRTRDFQFPTTREGQVTRFRFQSSTLNLSLNSRHIPREPRNLRYTKLSVLRVRTQSSLKNTTVSSVGPRFRATER